MIISQDSGYISRGLILCVVEIQMFFLLYDFPSHKSTLIYIYRAVPTEGVVLQVLLGLPLLLLLKYELFHVFETQVFLLSPPLSGVLFTSPHTRK